MQNITPDDLFNIYNYYVRCNKNISYKDFILTQSLINDYNNSKNNFNTNYKNFRSKYDKPIIWDLERKETTKYQELLNVGREFEVYVEDEFLKWGIDLEMYTDSEGQYKGENKLGLEIKRDRRLADTNNVYIQYMERMDDNKPLVEAGILKKDNSKYWIVGDYDDYYIFYKKDLISIYNKLINGEKIKGCRIIGVDKCSTSLGYIMNRENCKKIMITNSIPVFIGYYKRNMLKE